MIDFKLFQRPQRYIGNEWNVIKKNHHEKFKICIAYPNFYELGMSNLGLRIIYSLLNDFSDIVCERVFLPGEDLAVFLEKSGTELFSLETKTSLSDFEVIGFNLDYELNFTNFLYILKLGGVPLYSSERKQTIVMAGAIANPEPLAQFVDVFYLGEFEEVADKFVKVLRDYRDKDSRLKALSEIEGFYVPQFYRAEFLNNRYELIKIYPYAKLPLKRVYVKDLDTAYYPLKWLTPHTKIIHDRVPIEIARGCPNQCTFCQARNLYHPYRERKPQTLINLTRKIYENSGYENFSLLALSASDYSQIESIIDNFIDSFQEKKVGLSLPSLRVDDILGKLYSKIIPFKKTSLTVAVEAARQCLRNEMNKKIDVNKLFEAAKILRSLKLKHLKVYFMFGFPKENEDDLIEIGKFLNRLSCQAKIDVNASINIFCPKPFSAWQGVKMENEETLLLKRKILFENISSRNNIKLSISNTKKSILEAILSRADRKFSAVIFRAFLKGAHLNNSDDTLLWQIWEEAMREENIDYRFYLGADTENFPWAFIE